LLIEGYVVYGIYGNERYTGMAFESADKVAGFELPDFNGAVF
jgi:hypothetical protein